MTAAAGQVAKAAKKAAVLAAMSIAEDIAEGRVQPADLDAQALTECRSLFGRVAGPGDPLWELHVDVARQVLAVGGVPAGELAEWAAVQAAAEGVEAEREPSWIERALADGADDECICPPSTAGGLALDCPVHDVGEVDGGA